MIMKEKRNKIFRGCHCTNSGCVLFITLSVFVFFIEKMDNVVLQAVIFILVLFVGIAWVEFENFNQLVDFGVLTIYKILILYCLCPDKGI